VEVELKSGEPEAAIAFAMELQRHFALVPQGKSKFRRALELAQEE
jgi:inorganic triphosphatase YgiF